MAWEVRITLVHCDKPDVARHEWVLYRDTYDQAVKEYSKATRALDETRERQLRQRILEQEAPE